MSTYNIYKCDCGYVMDCTHSITVSLKIECPDCKNWLVHHTQIDEFTLEEWLS